MDMHDTARVIETVTTFRTAQELVSAIKRLVEASDQHPSTVYIVGAERLRLIEETLTDGSRVYNIELAE